MTIPTYEQVARQDAERIGRKLLAMDRARWGIAQVAKPLLRFQVLLLVNGKYTHSATLHAACHASACRQFLRAWPSRVRNCAVVLRAPCSKRYDHDSSARLVGQWSAWGVAA